MPLLCRCVALAAILALPLNAEAQACGPDARDLLEDGPLFASARGYFRRVIEPAIRHPPARHRLLLIESTAVVLTGLDARACVESYPTRIRGRASGLTSPRGYHFVVVRLNDAGDGEYDYGLLIEAGTLRVVAVVAASNFQP